MAKKLTFDSERGVSLLEVLIAVLITGIIATAGFQFYSNVSHQGEVQIDVSEMQNLCRTSMYDIRKALRSAGYMVSGKAFEINGDSLAVYYSGTQPIDTTLYFIQEYSDSAYAMIADLPTGTSLYYLMKQINSNPPAIYTDFVSDISFTQIDPSNVLVSITTQVPRGDDTYATNGGFRKISLTERVNVRNVN